MRSIATKAEEALRIAIGAWRVIIDVIATHAATHQLHGDCRDEIGVMLRSVHAGLNHARREICVNQHARDFIADFKTRATDARTNRDEKRAPIGAEFMHRDERRRNHSRNNTAPTCMHRRDRA